MGRISEIIFICSILIICYCYFLYPLLVKIIGIVYNVPVLKKNITPSISIIISAYNEAAVIKKTLDNKIKLNYPHNKLEILVVSDGSDDGTDEIVRGYSEFNIRLIRQEPRQGKTAAINTAILHAKGDIICFADANSIWDENALVRIVRNFSDAKVGYVTGKMVYVGATGNIIGDGCSAFMKYENKLREFETQIGSIVGVDGGVDAVRKTLYEPMRPDSLPDFVLPLKVIEKGYRVIYEPAALLKEESLSDTKDEFKMRVRVILRSFHALRQMKHLFNPFRYPVFSWQLFSHKLLRYFIWFFMLSTLIYNMLLFNHGLFYSLLLYMQIIFYVLVFIGYVSIRLDLHIGNIIYIPYYFFIVNFSSAIAFLKFLKKENIVTWHPRKG